MALTLGTTGMDAKTEAEVRAACATANAEAGGRWLLLGDDGAEYVIVDMDSLYGPMSWLRLHAAGRKVIGLTSVERSQTDYRLARPVSAEELAALMRQIQGDSPQPSIADVAPAHSTPAPAPSDQLPEPAAVRHDATETAPLETPAMAALPTSGMPPAPVVEPPLSMSEPIPAPVPEPVPALAPEPVPEPEPVAGLPPDRPLTHWVQRGGLERRVRLQQSGEPVLLIDPRSRVYHGPATLKPLAPYFSGKLLIEDFATPDAAAWETEAATLGPAQPLSRLQWLGNLLAGGGTLLPGFDPDGNYRLSKWPQTEREYPKHFRIATAMMKGSATLDEIAAASGVSRGEVADFVNANLATGYAEPVLPEPPAPEAPAPKPSGLFGRMRGR